MNYYRAVLFFCMGSINILNGMEPRGRIQHGIRCHDSYRYEAALKALDANDSSLVTALCKSNPLLLSKLKRTITERSKQNEEAMKIVKGVASSVPNARL